MDTETTALLARFHELAADRTTRHNNHEMLLIYYELIGDIMDAGWGPSHHFSPFRGTESLAEAIKAHECEIADQAGLSAGQTALDVGSGIGGPALTIAAHSGAHVTGLDLNPKRAGRARERADELGLSGQTSFVVGDAEQIPFPDNTFDVVYSIEAMCHMPDKQRVHAEMARVLKPGGTSIGTDWCARDGLTTAEFDHYIEPICRHHSIPNMSTPAKLNDWLRAAGYENIRVHDTPSEGSFAPNWETLRQAAPPAMESDDPALRLMGAGAKALAEAGPAGVFFVGTWQATKP